MSATNRGAVRQAQDAYLTPSWAILRFLEAYNLKHDAELLDPCAAGGELLEVVKTVRPDVSINGIEIRPECEEALKGVTASYTIGDFVEMTKSVGTLVATETLENYDYILTNFPFSLAEQFLQASQKIADVVITLQRINWLRGNGREHVMRKLRPGLFVLPDRPSFTGRGMDATEYAFFVFGDPAVAGRWEMLRSTSQEERSEWNERARELHPVLTPPAGLEIANAHP